MQYIYLEDKNDMLFNSIEFMVFFPVVLFIYFIIPRKLRSLWMLVASYYFYMSWNPQYAILIALSTVFTYAGGILVEKCVSMECRYTSRNFMRKVILIGCLAVNLAILGIFKYGNFLLDSLDAVVRVFGIEIVSRRFDLLLPVGISFYTFQALGYMIDVYRGDITAERNLLRYALFVSFFPQLVAGPIERSGNLLKQMREMEDIKLWNAKRITSGAILMVWGLFMKMVIADRTAILVDTVFDQYYIYGSTELCVAAAGFALQIYCDFGSYSLIAIGAAKIMGFTLMENFCAPYFAVSVKDFWSRWHISLSSWFKDYLYIPLGGSRKGKLRQAVNKMIVFSVSGLWHGADWSFMAWGGVHGFYQVFADLTSPYRKKCLDQLKVKQECFSWRLLQTAVTFLLVDFAWIFFRADSMMSALYYIKRIFIRPTPWAFFNGDLYTLGLDRPEMNILLFSVLILFLIDTIRVRKKILLDEFLFTQNLWFRWGCMIVLILMIFIFGEYGPNFDAQQFIYFQF